MSAVQSATTARMHYEAVVRKVGTGYTATINGASNPMRITHAAPTVAAINNVSYRHVIDTFA
jgi:hypothetical protein